MPNPWYGTDMKSGETGLEKIIEAAKLILSVCNGAFSRDKKGYDRFDAGYSRTILLGPDIFGREGLTPEEVEWLRRKLLRYKRQLQKEFDFDTNVLDKPVHPVAFYAEAKWVARDDSGWWRVSPHSLKKYAPEFFRGLEAKNQRDQRWFRANWTYARGHEPIGVEGVKIRKISIRYNDPDENGRTRKEWE